MKKEDRNSTGEQQENAPVTDRRQAILNAALHLFTVRGFHGTPTSLISREAGVATGTLFHYFPTKEDLIDQLYTETKEQMGRCLRTGLDEESTVLDRLRRVCANSIAWASGHPSECLFVRQFCSSPFVSQRAQEDATAQFLFLHDIIREGIARGIIRDKPPELIIRLFGGALFAGIEPCLTGDVTFDEGELTENVFKLIISGIATGKPEIKKELRE